MSAEPSPTPIPYAPRPSAARRWMRRLAVPLTLVLVLASARWWGPPVWYRMQVAFWYDRCTHHVAPAETTVWEMYDRPPGLVRVGQPYVPTAWQELYTLLSPPGFQSDGTVFLSGMRTPSGRKVLVAVDVMPPAMRGRHNSFTPARPRPSLHVRAFASGGVLGLPHQFHDASETFPVPRAGHVRLLPGKRDPADPAHFTIPYKISGQTGTINGWVREYHIDIEPLPSVTPPPPASPE